MLIDINNNQAFADLLWTEIYSKLDPATYGFGAPPPCPPGNPFFGCATSPAQGGGTAALLAGTGLLAALAFARRRRR